MPFPREPNHEQLPPSLHMLNRVILEGTSWESDHGKGSNAARSITQLMIYNSTKGSRKQNKTGEVHHYQRRETALPMYLGLLIHSKTRKRDLVDTLHKNGLRLL